MGVLAWGDIRLGRVRKEDETREKGRIKCETTSKSEMSRMDRRRKREGRGERERERERDSKRRAKRRAGANLACQEVAYSSRTKASRGTRARLEAALGSRTGRSGWWKTTRKMVELR